MKALKFTFGLVTICLVSSYAQQQPNFGRFEPDQPTVILLRGRNVKVVDEIRYTDPAGVVWIVPKGTISDGATIPTIFWSVVGGPLDGPYRDAALIHDVACCQQTRSWQDAAHMFYTAMRCHGTDEKRAKTMFFAVWAGGPHWSVVRQQPANDCLDITAKHRLSPATVKSSVHRFRAGTLNMDEKRAVVAPFVQGARADDRQIEAAFGELKTTDLLPSDKALIAEALQSTKTITADEAKSAADWIERENPSLAQIEAAADKAAEVGTQPVPAQSP